MIECPDDLDQAETIWISDVVLCRATNEFLEYTEGQIILHYAGVDVTYQVTGHDPTSRRTAAVRKSILRR